MLQRWGGEYEIGRTGIGAGLYWRAASRAKLGWIALQETSASDEINPGDRRLPEAEREPITANSPAASA